MNRALADPGRAEILQATGIFEDGWCEPVVRFSALARAPLATLQFTLWLKPESDQKCSPVRVFVNTSERLATEVPFDVPTIARVACPAGEGETLAVEIRCDN